MGDSMFKERVKNKVNRLLYPNSYSSEAYVQYLRKKGAVIGERTRFIAPKKCNVDEGRAEYITIGADCCLVFVTILAHDYSWYVFQKSYGEMLPDPGGKVVIGNNCFIGYQACILKNTIIGDNVIIGARSVVKGTIPSNTVWGGVPARQICTLDELYKKRKAEELESIFYRYEVIRNQLNTNDCEEEKIATLGMGYLAYCYLQRTEDNYDRFIKNIEFNGICDRPEIKEHFMNGAPVFNGYKEFVQEYNAYIEKRNL